MICLEMENEKRKMQEIKPVTCNLLPITYGIGDRQSQSQPITYNLLPITYFGPISWYSRLLRTENWAIDDGERYVKQTTRNHCLIATASGVQKLTVPVEKPSRSEERGVRSDFSRSEERGVRSEEGGARSDSLLTREVRISNHGKWRTEHWNALCTAYGESPFFDYYADDLRPFFERRDWELLFDYNLAILHKMLELLGIKRGKELRNDIQHSTFNTQHSYWQVYQRQNGFLPDLSIIDLLCCVGPEAVLYL